MKIKRDGNQLTIHKDGKKTVRKFVTPEQAIAAHDKLLAENERELAERRAAPRVDPRHAELEAQIANAPEDDAGYAVYADWLESQGDPRGRLIALQLAGQPVTQELTANRKYFLGPLAAHHKYNAFRWERGFINHVHLDRIHGARVEDVLAQLLDHPSGRFLVGASLRCYDDGEIQPAIDLLARRAPPSLRELWIAGAPTDDASRLLAAAPRLHTLSLAHLPCPALDRPALETLHLHDTAIPDAIPVKLRKLTLQRVTGDPIPLISDSLEELELGPIDDLGRILRALPVLPRLTTLRLSYTGMTSAEAFELARRPERFPRLEYLSAYQNGLAPEAVAALRRIAKTVAA